MSASKLGSSALLSGDSAAKAALRQRRPAAASNMIVRFEVIFGSRRLISPEGFKGASVQARRILAKYLWFAKSARFLRSGGNLRKINRKGNYLCRKFASNVEVVSSKSCCNARMGLRCFIANASMDTSITG